MGISLEKLLRQLGINPGDVTVDVPGGANAFYGQGYQDTEGSQSFTVPNGSGVDQRLSFVVGSCVVDNSTSSWINIPDATKDGLGRFVPPGGGAAVPILGHISRGRINWTAPAGQTQIPPVAGETAVVIFFASPVPPGLGITSVVSTKAVSGALNFFIVTASTYGATGDGVHDDTAAIQAAINAVPAGGGTVFFPAGTYKVTATITVPSFVSLVGAGYFASVIAPTAAVTGAVFSTSSTQKVWFYNLDITGPAAKGIVITSAGGVIVEAVRCRNMTSIGLDINNSNEVWVLHSFFENCTANGIRLLGTSNNCEIEDCSFNAQTVAMTAVSIAAAIAQTRISGCNFEGNVNGNVGVNCSGALDTVIDSNYFEQWAGACIAANSGVARGLVIRGNSMQATSAAAACVILNSAGPNNGVEIVSNDFPVLGNASQTATDVLLGSSTDVKMWGNTSGGASAASSEVWTVQGRLLPATPASAAQAAALFFVSGVPSNAQGSNGDWAMRTDVSAAGARIYHKEAGAWVATAA